MKKGPLFSRTKYAILTYENHIVIHGGEAELVHNSRQMMNSILYINASTIEYHEISIKENDIPYKKAHICFVIGNEMFFEGGMYIDDSIDSSMYALNMVTKKIRAVKFEIETEMLCHHKCVSINQILCGLFCWIP